ncbi:MAG: C39 family peptidase [Chloroflexota bacterium]
MRIFSPRTRRLAILGICTAVLCGFPGSTQAAPLVVLSGFPNLRQQHSLTCESSAVSMATRGLLTESQLMRTLPRSPNPNLGFRGNPDGEEVGALNDYGVYAAPLQRALLHFGYQSNVMLYADDAALKASIRRGWPVVVWISYNLLKETPRLAVANGVQFILVPREHAILARGFDNSTIIGNDPWNGHTVRYYWRDFNRSWGYFGNMGLSVEPCLMAQPVPAIHVAAMSSTSITWKWKAAPHADHYAVTVKRVGSHPAVVLQATQTQSILTLTGVQAGHRYEIDVQAVDACGTSTAPIRLLVQLPKLSPTSTPTPPEVTVSPAPTSTPTATPIISTTPIPAATQSATASATPRL